MAEYKLLELAFNKKLVTGDPATCIGDNFHELTNLRYRDTHVLTVGGMSKVNATPLTPKIISFSHFLKAQPQEGHIVAQVQNSAGSSFLYVMDIIPPATGAFGSVRHTDAIGAGTAVFSEAPLGNLVICNGAESLIWGGNELRIGSFLNYDPGGLFLYDYTDRVRNTLSDSANVATCSATSGGIDANTSLVLHCDSDLTDSSGNGHTFTGSGVTYDTTNKVFGSASALLNGASSSMNCATSADFSFLAGLFTIDMRIRPANVAAVGPLFYQGNDASNYIYFYQNASGGLTLVLYDTGAAALTLSTPNGVLANGTWAHVEVCESGNDWRIFVNGVQQAYASNTSRGKAYTLDAYIGRNGSGGSAYFSGNIDEVRFSKVARHLSSFEPQGTAYTSSTSTPWFYIGSTRPLSGFKLYISTPNTQTGAMSLSVWTGAWTPVSSLVDGTSVGGKSLAQTGSVTFSDTQTTATVKSINGTVLYWYRMNISTADAATGISHATVAAEIQPIVDLWDGAPRKCPAFMRNDGTDYTDYSGNIYENTYDATDSTSFVNLGGMLTTQFIIMGFTEPLLGVHVSIFTSKTNTAANTVLTASYWNGAGWTDLTGIDDGTILATASFGTTGAITWNPPTRGLEFQYEPTKDVPLYYYKFKFSQSFSANCHVFYITGIPAPKKISAYTFAMLAHNRLWLLCEAADKKNGAICSATSSSEVFNGDDTKLLIFGDDTPLIGGCGLFSQFGSNLYNITVFFKEGETWAVVGSTPEDWTQFVVSKTVGCVAPGSIAVATVTTALPAGSNTHVVLFQAADGVYAFDGRAILRVSDDVRNYFNQGFPESIPPAMISSSVGFFDNSRAEYHILIASGSGATALNTELVYDLRRSKWFKIVRPTGKELQCCCSTSDQRGNVYTYGSQNGHIMLLEDGYLMDGEGIGFAVRTGDVSYEQGSMNTVTALRSIKLLGSAVNSGGSLTVTHYADGAISGDDLSEDLKMVNSGSILAHPIRSVNFQGIFHSLRFSGTTSAGAPKQDLFGIGVQYSIVRTDS